MPTTIAAVLILVLAVVPGSLGVYVFAVINGSDWRQRDWEAAVQHVAFSAIGLLAYALVSHTCGLLPPVHVTPAAYQSVNAETIHLLLLPYLGHLGGGAVVGLLAALADRGIAMVTRGSHHPSAWNSFANKSLDGRWAVVTLTSGDVFAGRVAVADVGVPASERDVVLREPALYDTAKRNYYPTPFYEIFLPSALVQNIGVLGSPTDERIGPQTGQPLFAQETTDAGSKPTSLQDSPAS